MTRTNEEIAECVKCAAKGDSGAREVLLTVYRERLKRMVRPRLNRRLAGRIDESDIVQEAALEAAKRLDDYLANPEMPFYLWLRRITDCKLIDAHRKHLGAKQRDATQEVSLDRGWPMAPDSVSLAAQILGNLTGPTEAAIRAEACQQVQDVLNEMDPIDKEILALRHFEQMTNSECAQILELGESAASSRYLRALKRLKDTLKQIPGLFDG